MLRAGQFAFDCLKEKYPQVKNLIIFCGGGNNGGDGYVIAALAKQLGMTVKVYAVAGPSTDDAKSALDFAQQQNCEVIQYSGNSCSSDIFKTADLIVDALLGTGVDRPVTGGLADLIDLINSSNLPVLACDVPTGLNSDTGCKMGCSVKADLTTTFIALKAGMFTADGKECCGEIKFADLQIDPRAYLEHKPAAKLITESNLKQALLPRCENAHKGTTGYAAVIGGASGMLGAVLMAGKAAYRIGAGRVKVLTDPLHCSQLALSCPELLTQGVGNSDFDIDFRQFQAMAIGPGLTQSDWARAQFNQAVQTDLPLVVDADALNILASEQLQRQNWILTPHPGEAARLLNCKVSDVQSDRFAAAKRIVDQYGGVCVLKGSGTLVATQGRVTRVCTKGNSGQATAGMGDVLTGCILGLVAQGYELFDASCLGSWIHSAAADICADENGKIGMMATDLLAKLRIVHNHLACE